MSKQAVQHPGRAIAQLLDRRSALLFDPPDIAADGEVLLRAGWMLCIPAQPGVYLISDIRGPLYVGRTSNLRDRCGQHLAYSHNPLVRTVIEHPVGSLKFSWLLAPESEIPALEADLIDRLQPLCNQTMTVLTIDAHRSTSKED